MYRRFDSEDDQVIRHKDVNRLMKRLKIPEDDRVDLRKCLQMLESHDPIPCPWKDIDFKFYDAQWRAEIQAAAHPAPRLNATKRPREDGLNDVL